MVVHQGQALFAKYYFSTFHFNIQFKIKTEFKTESKLNFI